MPEVPTPSEHWERTLPASEALTLAEGFPRLLGDPEIPLLIPQYRARLFDGRDFRAHSAQELREDLEGIPDDEVRTIDLTAVSEKGHLTLESSWLADDPSYASTTLRGHGKPEHATVVHGAFAQAKQQVDRAFQRIDRAKDQAEDSKSADAPPPAPTFSVNVGGIGASVAVGGRDAATGPQQTVVAPATQTQPAEPKPRWWHDPWVYTIVGGLIVTVLAALILGR